MLARSIRGLARRAGYEITSFTPVTDTYDCLIHFAEATGVTAILDLGANVGQFAEHMLRTRWGGEIWSFEPLSAAHAELERKAAKHPRWKVMPRMAIGAVRTSTQINISGNSQSSSLLPILDRCLDGAPTAAYVGQETVEVFPLAEVLANRPAQERYLLKMDVQGFEADVLKGAEPVLDRCPVVFTEMSLQPLYQGEMLFTELSELLFSKGYRCVGLRPGYFDRKAREILQIDGMFVRS